VQGGPESDMIRVCDNGPGIPGPVLERLTREPVTTRAAQGGSGMGLVLSQRVMAALGGRVTIHSAPGAGTTVSLQFSVREDEKAHEVSP
jgi:two-component system, response regulator PhcR